MDELDERDVTDLDPHPDDGDLTATETLPHCKDPSHVHVAVIGAHATVKMTATHVDHLACKNTSYTGPGVVVSFRPGRPLDGLHLLPELVAVLPGWLRDAATAARATPGDTVAITHTSRKTFVIFGQALTAADAIALADAIEAAA